MMKLYHLTKSSNIDGILKNGLMPKIGENSKSVSEEEDTVYLCDKDSILYWKILLGADAIIEVEMEELPGDSQRYRTHDGSSYIEYMHYETIHSANLKIVHDDISDIDVQVVMEQLCVQYLHTLSVYATKCARYYNGKFSEKDKVDYHDYLLHWCNVLRTCLPRLDYASVDKSVLRNELKRAGENGEYTICDTYFTTGKRLWNQLIEYPEDDLSEHHQWIYVFIKDNLQGCLDVDTGGWCG